MHEHILPLDSTRSSPLNPDELSTLPAEILAVVFRSLVLSHQTHWLELDDVRRQCDHPMTWIPSLLHTCSLWRAISISSPELWNFVWVGRSEALTVQMLDWSRDEPLHIYSPDLPHAEDANTCASDDEPCGQQAVALGRVLKGTRKILSMHLWGPTHASSPFLFPELPDLEELFLSMDMPAWRKPATQSLEGFLTNHGRLRFLAVESLSSSTLSKPVRVFPATLTRLVLRHLDHWTKHSTWAWLENLPNLERLLLENGSLPPPRSSQSRFRLPELRKIHLGHMDTEILHNLLHLFDIPKCTHFNLHTRYCRDSLRTDLLSGIAGQLKRFSDNLEMMGATELHAHTSLSDYMVKVTVRRELDEGQMSIFVINFRFGDNLRPARKHYLPELWKSMTSLPMKKTDSETEIFVVAPVDNSASLEEDEGTESWELVSSLNVNS
ncbi:hypothetical protein DL96DRAFT_1676750 [Flagelloscypha sp. PMI_526]|nr:hypothetical protein DL96DRAFT_1676750 [Flagelloscypha sp. PMI_526]